MKRESIITQKIIHVHINRANEKEIDAAMKVAFETALSELKKGRTYRVRPKKIGKAGATLIWGMEDRCYRA